MVSGRQDGVLYGVGSEWQKLSHGSGARQGSPRRIVVMLENVYTSNGYG